MSTTTLRETLNDFDVLVVPGWRGSGSDHWQTRWETHFPQFRRVEQRDWIQPRRQDWVATLKQYIDATEKPVILIAHSLGCATVAHWATQFAAENPSTTSKIAGALLVAPADVERATVASSLRSFAPLPRKLLPFRSVLVASDNDPCCTAWRAAELADVWGSGFRLLPGLGHINADSHIGDWLEGLDFLANSLPEGKVSSAVHENHSDLYDAA